MFSDLQLRAAAAAAVLRPQLDGKGSQASKDASYKWVMMWDWKPARSRADHVAYWALAKKDWKKIIGEARGRGFCEPELADSPQRGAAGKAKHTPPASQRSHAQIAAGMRRMQDPPPGDYINNVVRVVHEEGGVDEDELRDLETRFGDLETRGSVPLLRGEVEDDLRERVQALGRELLKSRAEVVYAYNLFDIMRGMCMRDGMMHELQRLHVSAMMEHIINARGDDLLQGITHQDQEACSKIMNEASEIAKAAMLVAAKDMGYEEDVLVPRTYNIGC